MGVIKQLDMHQIQQGVNQWQLFLDEALRLIIWQPSPPLLFSCQNNAFLIRKTTNWTHWIWKAQGFVIYSYFTMDKLITEYWWNLDLDKGPERGCAREPKVRVGKSNWFVLVDEFFSQEARRGQVTPPGNKKKILGKNIQEYPKTEATRFDTKRRKCTDQQSVFQRAKGGAIFEIQTGNSSLKFLARGSEISTLKEC